MEMTEATKQALANKVLNRLEGDEGIQDVINTAIIELFEQQGIDIDSDYGFEAINDIATRFTLILN